MIIEKGDFKNILKAVREAYDLGCATVIYPEHYPSRQRDLRFCLDGYDVSLFYHHHPYNGDDFQTMPVRQLFEQLLLLDRRRVTMGEKDGKIDLDERMKEWQVVQRLIENMKTVRNSGCVHIVSPVPSIERDLYWLYRQPGGNRIAQKLWQRCRPPHMPTPFFLKKSFIRSVMEENVMRFNENQFRRIGAGDAFTPELQEKMRQGVPLIQHPYAKQYEDGKMETIFHLKKSPTSDHYFLNKIQATVQQQGEETPVTQTFYLSARRRPDGEDGGEQRARLENRYTLKAIYNALQGRRPIMVRMAGKDGTSHDVWEKINFRKKLENGNYEVKRYYTGYGFQLEQALSGYAIKDMENPQYKQRLMDSIYRGNLQKATFVDQEGKTEQLYVSPNIPLGALHVYDLEKRRIPTEQLAEKGYVTQAFHEKLKERMVKIGTEQRPQQEGRQLTAKQEGQQQKPKHRIP